MLWNTKELVAPEFDWFKLLIAHVKENMNYVICKIAQAIIPMSTTLMVYI